MPSEEPDNQANEHQSRNFFAAERTELADDRTLLAWYRTTFAAYALAVGLGGIVPVVAKSASSAYRVLGVIFAVLGAIAALAASATAFAVEHHLITEAATASRRSGYDGGSPGPTTP